MFGGRSLGGLKLGGKLGLPLGKPLALTILRTSPFHGLPSRDNSGWLVEDIPSPPEHTGQALRETAKLSLTSC